MNEPIACKFPSCSAFIYFAKSEKSGRFFPLDAQPFARDDVRPADRWLLTSDNRAVRVDGDRTTDNQPEVYVVHFTTCPGHMPEREQVKQRVAQPILAARLASYRRTPGGS